MRSKTFLSVLMIALSLSMVVPVFANNINPTSVSETPKEQLARQITSRLMEIKHMDKSELTRAEKKELKKEVKALRAQATSNGIYLSVGAIIIIILLLILLL